MLLNEFDFQLPKELIAQYPSSNKEDIKMLVFESLKIIDSKFIEILDFLQEEDVLVFNDVLVIKAKFKARISRTDKEVEFNLDQEIPSIQADKRYWRVILKGAKKVKNNDRLLISDDFYADIIEKFEDGFFLLEFDKNNFENNVKKYGNVPLPPYIKRDNTSFEDEKYYQTIYARSGCAVAAPTAGLHFNESIFAKLENKNIKKAFITLNVGAGTFMPVRELNIKDHKMHEEHYLISEKDADIINNAKINKKRIIAVGTTALRALESSCDENGFIISKKSSTNIFIYPPYNIKSVDGILTNFHLPKSTLFMLICAFIGKDNAFRLYKHAIGESYRFFSYGDCSLLFRE